MERIKTRMWAFSGYGVFMDEIARPFAEDASESQPQKKPQTEYRGLGFLAVPQELFLKFHPNLNSSMSGPKTRNIIGNPQP